MFGGQRVGIMRKFRKMTVQMHAYTPSMTLLNFRPKFMENRFDCPRRNIGADWVRKYRVKYFTMFMVHVYVRPPTATARPPSLQFSQDYRAGSSPAP